ncbi:hypothetical protein [Caulobacter sp. UC70_42]|uniref:hypothetical protein n=1 Tax=Caulobacter sp. UC70_42 TaxID=3374551 RepID=UPI0037573379
MCFTKSSLSVDQALSNNLRHGIVAPRMLRAFDDAFQTVYRRDSLDIWNVQNIKSKFGECGVHIHQYRESYSSLIKSFVDEYLTLKQKTGLDLEVRGLIKQSIKKYIQADKVRNRLESAIVASASRKIKSHLMATSKSLTVSLKPTLMFGIRQTRLNIGQDGSHEVKLFLDYLEANINTAIDDISRWIGVSETRGSAIPFTVNEVVKLYLISHHLFGWRKLSVDTRVKVLPDPTRSHVSIDGRYLDFFQEIVHNLLSNAYSKSGLGLKTEIELEFSLSDTEIRIICTNNISPNEISSVLSNYTRTVSLAKALLGDQARKDNASGFQKIRHAFHVAFGVQPRFNIPPISKTNRLFVIELFAKINTRTYVP